MKENSAGEVHMSDSEIDQEACLGDVLYSALDEFCNFYMEMYTMMGFLGILFVVCFGLFVGCTIVEYLRKRNK